MKQHFWLFCILLMIITITSSLGGGIRFRENFLEEVFDLNDITSELEHSHNYHPINFETSPSNLKKVVVEEEEQPPPKKIEDTTKDKVQVKLHRPNDFAYDHNYHVIEPYCGELYASY